MLEFWAEELEERTRDPRSPPPFLSQPQDETERCRQAETALLQESYKYVIMSDDTVLEICHDLWADECSWVLSRAVLDRPVGLLHSLIRRAAIQQRDSNPAFPVQMVGSSARGPPLPGPSGPSSWPSEQPSASAKPERRVTATTSHTPPPSRTPPPSGRA